MRDLRWPPLAEQESTTGGLWFRPTLYGAHRRGSKSGPGPVLLRRTGGFRGIDPPRHLAAAGTTAGTGAAHGCRDNGRRGRWSGERLRCGRFRRRRQLAVLRFGAARQDVLIGAGHLHAARVLRLHPDRPAVGLHHRNRGVAMADQRPAADHHQQHAAQPAGDHCQPACGRIHALAVTGDAIGRAGDTRDRLTRNLRGLTPDRIRGFSAFPRRASTPITARPERITTAVAATSASRASVSAGRSACRNRSVASSLPRFHSI